MKKFLSTILAVSMIGSAITVFADSETTEFDYSVPNTSSEFKSRKYIGPNLGKIKVVFKTEVTDELLNSITLTDSLQNAPVGGILKAIDSDNPKAVIVTFGELKENTSYFLTADGESIEYITTKKAIAEEDFDDWNTGTADIVNNTYAGFAENENIRYKAPAGGSFEIKEITENDKYIECKNTAVKSDLMLGVELPNEITDGTIVTIASIKTDKVYGSDCFGGIQGYRFVGQGWAGSSYENLSGYTKDDNGFYNITAITEKANTEYDTDGKSTVSSLNLTVKDNGSSKTNTVSTTLKTGPSDSKIHTSSIVKMYHNAEQTDASVSLSYYKTGLYTIPKILFDKVDYDSETKTVTFTANTDIDENTLNNIKLTDSDGYDVSFNASYSADDRKVTLNIGKPMSAERYLLNTDGVMSADGFKMTDTAEFENSVIEDAAFKLVNAYPMDKAPSADGYYNYSGKIGVNQENIRLVFNESIDKNTIGKVTFKDEYGKEPKGGIKVSAEENTLTVKFGELAENMKYTLYVPGTVIAENGDEMRGGFTLCYTTIAKKTVEADYTNAQTESFSLKGVTKLDAAGNLVVFDDNKNKSDVSVTGEEGSRYLRIVNPEKGMNTNLGMKLIDNDSYGNNKAFVDGKIVSKMTFKPVYAAEQVPNIKLGYIAHWQYTNTMFNNKNLMFTSMLNFNKDTDGFYNVYGVSEKKNTIYTDNAYTTTVKTTVYDADDSDKAVYAEQTRTSGMNFAGADSVVLASTYALNAGDGFDVAYVKAGYFVLPSVLGDIYYDGDKTVEFTAATDMNADTLNNLVIADENGNSVGFNAEYDNDTRKVTVKLANRLGNAVYTLSGRNVMSADGFAMIEKYTIDNKMTASVVITNENGEEINSIYGTDTVYAKYTVNNGGSKKSAIAFTAVYDGDKLINVNAKQISGDDMIAVSGYNVTAKTVIKAMLFEGYDTLIPICGASVKNIGGTVKLEAENAEVIVGAAKDNWGVGSWGPNKYITFTKEQLSGITPLHNAMTLKCIPHQAGKYVIYAGEGKTDVKLGEIVITAEDIKESHGWTANDTAEFKTKLDFGTEVPEAITVFCESGSGNSIDYLTFEG